MRRRTVLPMAAAVALAIPGTANADAERVEVCADRLELNREPNQGRDGELREGQSIALRKLSDSGKYAYGLAYGDINRLGWVRTAGLCDAGVARASADARLVGERVEVCADRVELNREPNHGWDGELRDGQSIAVRKLSDSGKYAYGLAYGDINRLGWVRTASLCGPGERARAASGGGPAGERLAVSQATTVTDVPNGTPVGTLTPPETFAVSKLSASGKYAYGFAYGEANEPGWILTDRLAEPAT
jgi:hypothetical protein